MSRRMAGLMGIALLAAIGCEREQAADAAPAGSDYDTPYEAYLTKDWASAKESMQQIIKLAEQDPTLTPDKRAHPLWLAHSRLYLMEKRVGNDAAADAQWVAARYWYLRKAEFADDALEWFTPEKCAEIIDKWDRGKTAGKGPRFAQVQ